MCGDKLYLTEQFIQTRFIDKKVGQRFAFEDSILLNIVNGTQRVFLKPEEDMLLRASTKESHGVNMKMSVCERDDSAQGMSQACLARSSQVGNHQMVYATLKKGTAYDLILDYTNSILALSSFYDCPHAQLKVQMTRLEEA